VESAEILRQCEGEAADEEASVADGCLMDGHGQVEEGRLLDRLAEDQTDDLCRIRPDYGDACAGGRRDVQFPFTQLSNGFLLVGQVMDEPRVVLP